MIETIRLATIGDAEAVTTITRAAYVKWVPIIGRQPLPMKADHAAHIRDHRTDLLLLGEVIVAVVETIQHADYLLIENVAVAPPFQKRGFGRRMIAHAERIAATDGFGVIRLYTNVKFEENIRLYASLGYKAEREEAMNGGTIVYMAKSIC